MLEPLACIPSLDHQETNRTDEPSNLPSVLDTAAEVEGQRWCNRENLEHRRLVQEALERLKPCSKRLQRYSLCGAAAWVMSDKADSNHLKIASMKCRDRFCPTCARHRSWILSGNVAAAMAAKPLRFMTLTLVSSDLPLSAQIDKLYSCFAKLRKHREIKDKMKGGVFFLEITHSGRANGWHPHLHLIWEGEFIQHAHLSCLWHTLTGDSYVVDVRAIRNSTHLARYVVKYTTKPFVDSVLKQPDRLDEAITALHGRRSVSTFGTWRGLKLTKPVPGTVEWRPVCPLGELLIKARHGDDHASRLLQSLMLQTADPFDQPTIRGKPT